MVENYFYKYLDEMNEKLDDVTETISTKVDKYISFIQKKLQHPSESENGNLAALIYDNLKVSFSDKVNICIPF